LAASPPKENDHFWKSVAPSYFSKSAILGFAMGITVGLAHATVLPVVPALPPEAPPLPTVPAAEPPLPGVEPAVPLPPAPEAEPPAPVPGVPALPSDVLSEVQAVN
jgi:hypothetical protein